MVLAVLVRDRMGLDAMPYGCRCELSIRNLEDSNSWYQRKKATAGNSLRRA